MGEYKKSACSIADAEATAFGRNDIDLCYKYTVTALDAAVWIVRACRGSCQLTQHSAMIHVDGEPVLYRVEQAFILFCCELIEYVERACTVSKLGSEYDSLSLYDIWPTEYKATAFMAAGWSAIEATINFLCVLQDACMWTLPHSSVAFVGLSDELASTLVAHYKSAMNTLVVEPKPDKDIVEWKTRIIDKVNVLLPVEDWPEWKINREASSLLNQISAEFGQVIKKRGNTAASKGAAKPAEDTGTSNILTDIRQIREHLENWLKNHYEIYKHASAEIPVKRRYAPIFGLDMDILDRVCDRLELICPYPNAHKIMRRKSKSVNNLHSEIDQLTNVKGDYERARLKLDSLAYHICRLIEALQDTEHVLRGVQPAKDAETNGVRQAPQQAEPERKPRHVKEPAKTHSWSAVYLDFIDDGTIRYKISKGIGGEPTMQNLASKMKEQVCQEKSGQHS